MGPKNIVVAAVLVVALAAGIFVAARLQQPPAELRAALVLPAPTPLPEFTLLDQFGNGVTRASFRDSWSLVFFGFTHCPDICPTTLQVLASAKEGLRAAGHQPLPRIVLVSVDPERDTPEAMKEFAEKQGVDESRWLFLTGDKKNLEFIVKQLGQYTQEVEAHSTLMLAGNDRTRHWTRVMPMVPPEGVAQQLRALAEEKTPG